MKNMKECKIETLKDRKKERRKEGKKEGKRKKTDDIQSNAAPLTYPVQLLSPLAAALALRGGAHPKMDDDHLLCRLDKGKSMDRTFPVGPQDTFNLGLGAVTLKKVNEI